MRKAFGALTINNDTIWYDTSGNEIKCQGGSILKVGSTYYWYGMELIGGSTGQGNDAGVGAWNFQHCKVYSSTDLKNWTFQANVLSPGAPTELSSSDWVGRPNIFYNATTAKYVLITEWNNDNTRNKIAYLQSSSPTGPFTWVKTENTFDGYSIGDMGSYIENGTAYLVITYDKGGENATIGIGKLAADYLSMASVVYTKTSGGQEANGIIKKGSTYYWFNSGTDWWFSTATQYATSTNLAGPWTAFNKVSTNPASNNSFNTQHDFILPVTGSTTTSYIYCGDRYSNFHGQGIGRNAWYPLTFDASGVPTINGYQSWTID